jgi:lysozyme family protein
MIGNRTQALAYIDEDEGPEVNVSPSEPGGISCRGVSLTVLQEYHAAHGLPKATADDVRKMTAELAGEVYSWRFLDPIRFDELPNGIDYRIADCAITLGLTGACVATQMALAMWPVTGKMDDTTIGALHAEDPRVVVAALDAAWITWKHGQGADGWATHGHGWMNRVRRVRDRSIQMMAGARV